MLTPLGAMQLAINEARKGLGFVAPNPPVGAVIVDREGQFLSKGFHHKFGGDHAEIDALKNLENEPSRYRQGASLEGATIYVTLEPCAHEGKTPSCAKRLAQLPFKRIVYGLIDPNPLVAGQGNNILRAAGKEVLSIAEACRENILDFDKTASEKLQQDLESLAEVFLFTHRFKKPFVALKVATTLDGCLAHITGESKWLTGDRSREHVHHLRAQYDAVVIGKETFLRDNPFLNIRNPRYAEKINKVIVLDARAECTEEVIKKSNLAKVRPLENIYFASITSRDLFGAQRIVCRDDGFGRVSLDDMLGAAFRAGIHSLFVEGGARVASAFLEQRKVQRFYQFIAPKILGAKSGVSYTSNLNISQFADHLQLHAPESYVFGSDVMITGRLG